MARRNPRPTVREENEHALLEAAEWVFAEQGLRGRPRRRSRNAPGFQGEPPLLFPDQGDALPGGYRAGADRLARRRLVFRRKRGPATALSAYIGAKMDLAREMPLATRIWSAEIMRGAPMIQDFLDTTLTEWVVSREQVVRRWIAAGKLKPIEPKFLFYMIWATTQQYANAAHEMATLNKGRPLDDKAFERAKSEVIEIILRGVAAG